MTLAEPEGYVRVFIDEGPPIASLLQAAAKQGIARNYVRRLLAAVGETGHDSPIEQALIEPLSERELTCSGCSEQTWTARTSPAN